jgi:DNA-binding CsgD family transcriptional regulator
MDAKPMMASMSRRTSSPVFVGRRYELGRLESALDAAASGRPSLVLVAGEAGVGKSRLLAEFSARASGGGARTLVGGCLDLGEGGLPFAPFAEALKGLAKALGLESEGAVAAVFGSSAHALAGLVPDLRTDLQPGARPVDLADQARRQARLFDAVLDVLGRLSAASPVVLVLEDIHWADGSTRDLVRFLLRNIRDERLLIVATLRSDELHRRHPLMRLLSELERLPGVERRDVAPFDREEIVEQVTAILGHPPPAESVDRVLERSDGLPFYVEELVATEAAGGTVPGSVRDIVGQSLATLPDGSVSLVRAAAVIGGWFTLDRLAAVAGLGEAALLHALRDATDARVLVSSDGAGEPTYGFRHALLREAAYEELLPAERVRFHARLAEHLTDALAHTAGDEPALIADLAIHTYHAGDQPRALTAAVRAVHALADASAFREALGHAERALELWPHVADAEAQAGISHGELLAIAGQVGAGGGVPGPALAHSRAALEELESSASSERLAALLIDISDVAFSAEAFETAWACDRRLGQLVEALPASTLKVYALVVVADGLWSTGHVRESVDLAESAMAIAGTLGNDHVWAVAARDAAALLAAAGRAGRAEALVDAAEALVGVAAALSPGFDGTVRSFESAISGQSAINACWALWHAGRFQDSATVAADAGRAAIRYGVERRSGAWHLDNEAHAMLELGRLEEAERLARSVGKHRFLGNWRVVLKVEVVRGRLDAARAALPMAGGFNSPLWNLEAEAVLERAAGSFDRIRTVVDEAEAERGRTDLVSPMWLLLGTAIGAAADHAVAARQRRRPAQAVEAEALGRDWLARLREIVDAGRADGGAGAFCEATLATAEGEMRRLERNPDPAAWSSAAGQWRALSHPYGTAYAELRLAEALLAADGDRVEAARVLREAHAATIALGAVPLRTQIETLARHAKIELAPDPDAPVLEAADAQVSDAAGPALTARERDVLRLVAEGHTNREIGDRLFIAEKTASVHVSNAMSKLGALSRYEAAAAAERGGFLD